MRSTRSGRARESCGEPAPDPIGIFELIFLNAEGGQGLDNKKN